MDLAKVILDNPITVVAVVVIILLAGLLVGFFFRRKASEQALEELLEVRDAGRKIAEKVIPTKQFENAADHQSAYTLRSEPFAKATGRVIENDHEVGEKIRRIVFDHPMFIERTDARIAHKSIYEKLDQELRFEKFRNEIGAEIRATVAGSQTAIFKRFDDLLEQVGEIRRSQMEEKNK